jgi:DNA-binding MarR family transcriptional regulator
MAETAREAVGPRGTQMAEECLAVRVRLLSRRLSRIYDGALRPLGLTVAQLNVLSVIEVIDCAPAGRVADLLAMEISTLSRNAHIMENEGWITIERAERGNGRILRLTSAGRQKLRKARPAWDRAQTEARELLGDEGTQELKRLGDGVWDDQLKHL